MKQTRTEIFIEVEEIISIRPTTRKRYSDRDTENLNSVIEICPHCHQTILGSTAIETIENNLKLVEEN